MSSSRSHAPLSGCSAPQQDVARRPVAAARRLEHVREALAPARDAVDRAGVPGAREVLGREEEDPHLAQALAPHVITNGRNLWVHWRRIDKDALVVVVDVKLPYPGGSTAYYDAVGQCNVLIAKAIQDAGAELCLPTSRRVDIKK